MKGAAALEWIDRVVSDWREYRLQMEHIRVAAGEIPSAQASILADIAANKLRAILSNAEHTRHEVAMRVFKDFYGIKDNGRDTYGWTCVTGI